MENTQRNPKPEDVLFKIIETTQKELNKGVSRLRKKGFLRKGQETNSFESSLRYVSFLREEHVPPSFSVVCYTVGADPAWTRTSMLAEAGLEEVDWDDVTPPSTDIFADRAPKLQTFERGNFQYLAYGMRVYRINTDA
jgi:hypothetical protein